eukprot:2203755-Rhodomonas_salina.1
MEEEEEEEEDWLAIVGIFPSVASSFSLSSCSRFLCLCLFLYFLLSPWDTRLEPSVAMSTIAAYGLHTKQKKAQERQCLHKRCEEE